MSAVLVLAAAVCSFFALLIALGTNLWGSTWSEWIAGALLAWFLSLLIPWVEARQRTA